jgi:hypothetical protein
MRSEAEDRAIAHHEAAHAVALHSYLRHCPLGELTIGARDQVEFPGSGQPAAAQLLDDYEQAICRLVGPFAAAWSALPEPKRTMRAAQEIVLMLMHEFAQACHDGTRRRTCSIGGPRAGDDDERIALRCADHLANGDAKRRSEFFGVLYRDAARFARNCWPQIERLAALLCEKRSLTGTEVAALLDAGRHAA